jgi:hypothetical protein
MRSVLQLTIYASSRTLATFSTTPQRQLSSSLREKTREFGDRRVGDFVSESAKPLLLLGGVFLVSRFLIGT